MGYTKDATGNASAYQTYQFLAGNDHGTTCDSLAACYDNTGISSDTAHSLADFDGNGRASRPRT